MYAGMYAQANQAAMYASITVGYAAWTGLYLWLRAGRPAPQTQRRLPAEGTGQPGPGGKLTPWPGHVPPHRAGCSRPRRPGRSCS